MESRLRMLSALNDFYIQGVETSIPLYKTILKTDEYKNGQLTTDFLKRYDMINRLKEDIKNEIMEKQLPATAAAIMYSEFFQSKVQSSNGTNSNWKTNG